MAALYALAFGGPSWFGAIAPIGGVAFILGRLNLGLAGLMKANGRWWARPFSALV